MVCDIIINLNYNTKKKDLFLLKCAAKRVHNFIN